MDIVFLDASVLFSAAYRSDNKLLKLWELPEVRLVSSPYAIAEANRNLAEIEQRDRLSALLQSVIHSIAPLYPLPAGVDLPAKDKPILQAAIAAHATHLLTGGKKHFGPYFGQAIEGVTIFAPAAYFKLKA
ncbi:MAG: PIN domain-containing protein [Bryobacteraceae bacterium]